MDEFPHTQFFFSVFTSFFFSFFFSKSDIAVWVRLDCFHLFFFPLISIGKEDHFNAKFSRVFVERFALSFFLFFLDHTGLYWKVW